LCVYFEKILSTLFILALIGAISLLGQPIWAHAYYFFGASLISLVLVGKVLFRFKSKKAYYFLIITLNIGVLYNSSRNLWIANRAVPYTESLLNLVKNIPNDAKIITDDFNYYPEKLFWTSKDGTLAPSDITSICKRAGYNKNTLAFLIEKKLYDVEMLNKNSCLYKSKLLGTVYAEKPKKNIHWALAILEQK